MVTWEVLIIPALSRALWRDVITDDMTNFMFRYSFSISWILAYIYKLKWVNGNQFLEGIP